MFNPAGLEEPPGMWCPIRVSQTLSSRPLKETITPGKRWLFSGTYEWRRRLCRQRPQSVRKSRCSTSDRTVRLRMWRKLKPGYPWHQTGKRPSTRSCQDRRCLARVRSRPGCWWSLKTKWISSELCSECPCAPPPRIVELYQLHFEVDSVPLKKVARPRVSPLQIYL